ncbi:MAG: hypothetical protein MRY63_06665 [Neomegalonema sp.]|nr:hypothetical protein [Neomegalonema sp.]
MKSAQESKDRGVQEALDPRGLIADAYRIEGIGAPDCRSIFLDWALGLPDGTDMEAARSALHARYGAQAPEHPMSKVLAESPPARKGRRRRS